MLQMYIVLAEIVVAYDLPNVLSQYRNAANIYSSGQYSYGYTTGPMSCPTIEMLQPSIVMHDLRGYDLKSYDLCSYGLRSCGRYSYGLYSHGLLVPAASCYTYCLYSHGLHSYGYKVMAYIVVAYIVMVFSCLPLRALCVVPATVCIPFRACHFEPAILPAHVGADACPMIGSNLI